MARERSVTRAVREYITGLRGLAATAECVKRHLHANAPAVLGVRILNNPIVKSKSFTSTRSAVLMYPPPSNINQIRSINQSIINPVELDELSFEQFS